MDAISTKSRRDTSSKQEMGHFYNGLSEKKDAILDEIKSCPATDKSFDKGKANLLRKELARIDSLLEDASSWFCGIIPLSTCGSQLTLQLTKRNDFAQYSSDSDSSDTLDDNGERDYVDFEGIDVEKTSSSEEFQPTL